MWWLRGHKAETHRIHHLMTLVVVLKVTTLMFESVMYHYIALTGHSTGWNVAYYIATFIRGSAMIVVVALIGTGWSLLKPFLNDREKKIIVIALGFQVRCGVPVMRHVTSEGQLCCPWSLQIINNIAIIFINELAPGSIAFDQWIYVLHIAGSVPCCLLPRPAHPNGGARTHPPCRPCRLCGCALPHSLVDQELAPGARGGQRRREDARHPCAPHPVSRVLHRHPRLHLLHAPHRRDS